MKLAVVALVLAASSQARADDGDRWDPGTISVRALGGTGTAVLVGGAAGLVGAGIGQLIDSHNWAVPLAGAAFGLLIGGSVGMVWAVNYIGDERGANGSPLGATIGLASGVLVLA